MVWLANGLAPSGPELNRVFEFELSTHIIEFCSARSGSEDNLPPVTRSSWGLATGPVANQIWGFSAEHAGRAAPLAYWRAGSPAWIIVYMT
jgi:hypothetical protein